MASAPTKKQQQNLRMDDDETFDTGEAITISDGTHKGAIKQVHGEVTPQGYRYVQLTVSSADFPDAELRYGCPLPEGKPVTPKSKLGQLLEAFGLPVEAGASYSVKNIREAIEGKPIVFITMNKPSDKNPNVSFANIVEGSIKPVKN